MARKKKVLVGGVFDILHYGHLHFLKNARALGNYLIIALESDKNVKRLKGESRPIHSQKQRQEILKALEFVDEVIILGDIMKDKDYEALVLKVKPDVIAVTQGDPVIEKKKKQANKVNATVIEIPKLETASTSQIAKLLDLE